MPQSEIENAVFTLERSLGASWTYIHAAREATTRLHGILAEQVNDLTSEDTSIVLFGSVGRLEFTSGGDVDWTFLIDGQADLKHQNAALQVGMRIERAKLNQPGREGVFGVLALSHDLLQYIGGQDDTNANLTRRILLLLESRPIGRRDAYDRVVRAVLNRYLSGDYGWIRGRTAYGVPRFLHNDIVRYWRTVTVDFAYKQLTRSNKGWALRSAKLRMSRKLTYAAGLLYCFSLAGEALNETEAADPSRLQKAIERLWMLTESTPLDLLAEAFMKSQSLMAPARLAFDAYDRFLGLLDSVEDRRHLEALDPDTADHDARYRLVRELGLAFQQGLTTLFLDDVSTNFPALTKEYGVF